MQQTIEQNTKQSSYVFRINHKRHPRRFKEFLQRRTHGYTRAQNADGHSFTRSNFSSLRASKEPDGSKNLRTYEHPSKTTQRFKFTVQIAFPKALFVTYHPYCRLCSSAHTYPNILMLPQEVKLEFSRLKTC